MQEPLTISPNRPPFASMDYALLREQGIELIQKLSSQVWTDYNVHDPGITILEHVAYGITDLGYRTNFDIKDLLTSGSGGADALLSQFFTPGQVLVSRPATLNDYRKIIIDHENIRRAWIQKATGSEQNVYLNDEDTLSAHLSYVQNLGSDPLLFNGMYTVILEFEEDRMLGDLNSTVVPWVVDNTFFLPLEFNFDIEVEFPKWNEAPEAFRSAGFSIPSSNDIGLRNLRLISSNVYRATVIINHFSDPEHPIEFEVKIDITSFIPRSASSADIEQAIRTQFIDNGSNGLLMTYQKKINRIYTILDEVKYMLMDQRNLSEDFFEFKSMEVEEVAICAEIEIELNADADLIQARILYELGKIISPTVEFKTLQELLAQGKKTDEIFEGPLLQHGFVDNEELKKIDQFPTYYISQFIDVIMDIEGVKAVRDLNATTYIDNIIRVEGDDNCFSGSEQSTHRPKLSVRKTRIFFNKDDNPNDKARGLFIANRNRVDGLLHELLVLDLDPKISDDERDLPIPLGEKKDVLDYFSVQSDFPMNYGVGEVRLASDIPSKRIAQVKQMKAYLLFYEQNLANFLAQLYHINQLFSFDENIKQTYFSQPLYKIPFVANLIKAFTDTLPPETNLDDFNALNPLFNEFIDQTRTVTILSVDDANKTFYVAGNLIAQINQEQKIVVSDAGLNNGVYTIQQLLFNGSDTEIIVVESIPTDAIGKLTYIRTENDYEKSIRENQETEDEFLTRRSRFLDHLLARFSESFVDLLIAGTFADESDKQKLVDSKAALLKIYPEISSNRGGAFNYKKIIPYDIVAVNQITRTFYLAQDVTQVIGIGSEVIVSEAELNDGTYHVVGIQFESNQTQLVVEEAIPSSSTGKLIYLDIWNTENISGYEKRVAKFLGIDDFRRRNLFFNINDYLDKLVPFFEFTSLTYIDEDTDEEVTTYGFILKDEESSTLLQGEGYLSEEYRLQVISDLITYGYNRCYYYQTGPSGSLTFEIKKVNNQGEESNLPALPSVDITYPEFTLPEFRSARIDAINRLLYLHYWNHEGLHMIEHLLLRPKINAMYYRELEEEMLADADGGSMVYQKSEGISSVDLLQKKITVNGVDLTAELYALQEIQWIGSTNAMYDGKYTVASIVYESGNTVIYLLEPIASTSPFALAYGSIWYDKTVPIDHITALDNMVLVASLDLTLELFPGTEITVFDVPVALDNASYIVGSSSLNSGDTEITLQRKKVVVQDHFLPVSSGGSEYEEDCTCPSFYDPYNFRVTMFLPSWVERSRTKAFRTYAEQIIRSETPAHIYVNIFWLGTFQMRNFEQVYRPWLEENAKPHPDPIVLSDRLNTLLKVLPALKNEYVPAELHNINDKNDSGSLLVLGETALGTY